MPPFKDRAPQRRLPQRWLSTALALAAALLLGGCLNNRSQQPDYHLLTARASEERHPLGTTIGVGPVRVAPFLNANRIVLHGGGGQLQVAGLQRWGEPLDQGVQRVMVQNMAVLTGAKLRNFPWRQRATPRYAIRLDVFDLDRLPDGSALLEANWQLEDLKESRLARSRRERLTLQPADAGYPALVDAYSDLLAELAQRVARAVAAEAELSAPAR
jgi:hypothetical protein